MIKNNRKENFMLHFYYFMFFGSNAMLSRR
jgi:hypothetical protein